MVNKSALVNCEYSIYIHNLFRKMKDYTQKLVKKLIIKKKHFSNFCIFRLLSMSIRFFTIAHI